MQAAALVSAWLAYWAKGASEVQVSLLAELKLKNFLGAGPGPAARVAAAGLAAAAGWAAG